MWLNRNAFAANGDEELVAVGNKNPSNRKLFEKGNPGGAARKGVPNKATREAREAIAAFVDGNAYRLQAWLDEIANGLPKLDNEGKPIAGVYLVDPNPTRAFELFQSVIEYHVPKLARTEVVGEDGKSAFQIHINA